MSGSLGHAHNEEAFRYLLTVERKRASRARRSVLLLLVNLRKQPGGSARIPRDVAGSVFLQFVGRTFARWTSSAGSGKSALQERF